jgi:hypothetical protein
VVTFDREDLDKFFNYVPAGKTYLGDDFDEYWWCEAHTHGEGYWIIWANGETHHTYRRPDEIYS